MEYDALFYKMFYAAYGRHSVRVCAPRLGVNIEKILNLKIFDI